jgi:hypothetical protein
MKLLVTLSMLATAAATSFVQKEAAVEVFAR